MEMERLTVYTPDGYESINPVDLCLDEYSGINFERILDKLGKYEDLEEQGLLLRLPCKVGDRLYRIDFLGFIISDTVHSIHILQNTAYLEMNYWDEDIYLSEVGKTAFLTKSEAEAKLKELRFNHD